MSTPLCQVVEWARPFVSNLMLLGDANGVDPALTNANIILGTILGPPFVWEWNRNTAELTLTATDTDIQQAIADFGFIECASIKVPSGASSDANTIYNLQPVRKLEMSYQPGRPSFICVFLDDMAGNITFRVGSVSPDLAYLVVVTYQKALLPMKNIAGTLPIPDKLMHIFRYGFLALAFLYNQDSRFEAINQKFIGSLLSAQGGLTETERNIFLSNWYSMISDEGIVALRNQQSIQARGIQ